ncbi:MAG: GMC oxidoreductase [Paracoccaceae bacterium]
MFHTSRSLAVWSSRAHPHRGPGNPLVLRDFYDTPWASSAKSVVVGLEASCGYTLALRQMLTQSRFARIRCSRSSPRLPALAAAALLGRAAIFDLMMEDLLCAEPRRPRPAALGMRFDTVTDEGSATASSATAASCAPGSKNARTLFLTHGVQLSHGHPMGTCRIGRDPVAPSPVRRRVHGLDNLYIGDGSFLPGLGGTNPSLTIAAHGLRPRRRHRRQPRPRGGPGDFRHRPPPAQRRPPRPDGPERPNGRTSRSGALPRRKTGDP